MSRLSYQRLESRRLLAARLDAAGDGPLDDYETDARLIERFYGPLVPGRPVPPIQGIAPLVGETPDGDFPVASDEADDEADGGLSEAAPFSLDDTFTLHSRPDSNFTIYLDFDGHTTTDTSWNTGYGMSVIEHPNYWGGTGADFSAARLELIQQIWQIVAEDFAPFDVNVTTQEPGDLDDLRYNGSQDTRWGTRVVMTKDTFADCSCGGHAYLGAFDDRQDEPALVYNNGLNTGSETASHEVGHQLGLHHDGAGSKTYYSGHGSGSTGWGPIMGSPFSKQITQWSAGDYYNASLTDEDDLQRITGSSNFPYNADDHANDPSSASPLRESGSVAVDEFGIIERNDDVDWFQFSTGGGNVSLQIDVLDYKPNLDVWAGLYDASGTFLVDSNPQTSLSASLQNIPLAAGDYFLKIDGVPRDGSYDAELDAVVEPTPAPYTVANPLGYSDYGSLGQYRISGTIIDPGIASVSITATAATVAEGEQAEFTLSNSDGGDGDVIVEVRSVRQSAPGQPAPNSTEPADFGAPLRQTVSMINGSGTLRIPIVDDAISEGPEFFEVHIVDAATYAVADRVAAMEVEEIMSIYSIDATATIANEGDSGIGSTHQFTIDRDGPPALAHEVHWRRVFPTDTMTSADPLDFISPASGSVFFEIGETSQTLEIEVLGDTDSEPDESYSIELYVPTGGTYQVDPDAFSADGQIINDDPVLPEITLRGDQALSIDDGAPAMIDNGTDMGLVDVQADTQTQTFAIENDGGMDLYLSSIAIYGAHSGDFSVTRQPAVLVGPGGSTTFDVTFDPTAAGRRDARILISSNDPDESVFDVPVSGLATDLRVERVEVNQGAISRSRLDSVTVVYNQPVDHQSLSDAFEIRNLTTGRSVDSIQATPADIDGRTEVVLTFENQSGAVILDDGNYELRVRSSAAMSLAVEPYPMRNDLLFGSEAGAVDRADAFFRLFGDSDGDRDVDGQDYGRFGLSFLRPNTAAEFNDAFDADRDGDVDGLDYGQFVRRLLTTL
ncbi:choice-of-anchor D domain-containing protein [Stieleria neptunia]|nr:choice-of-anchor D domain-containing protein [Stieleria neptunia]